MATYSEAAHQRCAVGEQALARALEEGYQPTGDEIARAWPDANDGWDAPPEGWGRWSRLFGPAIEAGRVRLSRHGRNSHYTLASHTHLPIRERPIGFTPAREARSKRVEALIAAVARREGHMLHGSDIMEAYRTAHGEPRPNTARWRRTLEPGIHGGRVRAEQVGAEWFYAPAGAPHLRPPPYWSDLMRVEAALHRAVERAMSPVLLEHVAAEISADPELAMTNAAFLQQNLASLVTTNRATQVRPFARQSGGRVYFTTLTGPQSVRTEVEHHLDKRLRAVRQMWRSNGGRPFTTQALRRYTREHPSFSIKDDAWYGWTNALHHLEGTGDVVRIPSEDSRWVRWAPAADWNALAPSEREARRLETHGRLTGHAPDNQHSGGSVPAGGHDSSFTSSSQNMRALVRAAKRAAAQQETDLARREVVAGRPVTLRELAEAAKNFPLLGPASGVPLRIAAKAASRLRPGMRKPAVVSLGTVGRTSYYDTHLTDAARAYVEYRHALWRALHHGSSVRSRDPAVRVARLTEAAALSATGSLPIGSVILTARITSLAATIHRTMTGLRTTAARVRLLEEEAEAVGAVLSRSAHLIDVLRGLLPDTVTFEDDEARWSAEWVIDIAEAAAAASTIEGFTIYTPRTLGTRMALVDTIPASEIVDAERLRRQTTTRPVETWLDRVGFALYVAVRWGGPNWASLGQRAVHTLGDLRRTEPVIRTLFGETGIQCQAGAAASLAFMGTRDARRALVDFIESQVARRGGITAVAALEAAVIGLARHPFGGLADRLLPVEEAALARVAASANERLRWFAQRARATWESDDACMTLFRT